MKKISIENIIEIAETDDAWLIKRSSDEGDYITTIMKQIDGAEDSKEHVSAIKELLREILFNFLINRRKYAKNWIEIKQLQREDIDKDFVELKEDE